MTTPIPHNPIQPSPQTHSWGEWLPTEELDDLDAEFIDGLELPPHRICQDPGCGELEYDPNTSLPVGYAADAAVFCLDCAHTMYAGYPVKEDAGNCVDFDGYPLGTIYANTIWPTAIGCSHCGQLIECSLEPNPVHQVAAFFTEQEYEQRRAASYLNKLQSRVKLQAFSVPAQQSFTEDDIPRILLDAARSISNPDTQDFDRRQYDTTNWPLKLKTAIMQAASEDWYPDPDHTRAPWNEYSPALTLFQDHPELKEVFRSPPDDVAQAWLARNPQAGLPDPRVRIRDFDHPAMIWSMYEDATHQAVVERIKATIPPGATDQQAEAVFEAHRDVLRDAFDDQLLILKAPKGLPDGVYKFSIQQGFGEETTGYGVVITNGRFDPELTAHAIFVAQAGYYQSPNFDHVYIEKLTWNGEIFEASIGS